MTLRDVIEKYFKEERTLNFHPSDTQGDCYLRYRLNEGASIVMGSDEGEEVTVFFTRSPETLDVFLKLLIYQFYESTTKNLL